MRGQAAANGIAWADISGANININPNKAGDVGQKGGSTAVTPARKSTVLAASRSPSSLRIRCVNARFWARCFSRAMTVKNWRRYNSAF